MYTQEIIDRFWSKVNVNSLEECWPYERRATGGYGQVAWKALGGITTYAHRMAYEITNGEIPDGYVIDHECHNLDKTCPGGKCKHRACCNPSHLIAKTIGANVKAAASSRRERKSHCPHNHEFTPENTLIFGNGYRQCRRCAADRANRWYANKKKG